MTRRRGALLFRCCLSAARTGWLLGGGLGPLDRSLGLGVDNVLEFELVLADGSVATVDACSEPELFWALRGGGGGNYGVVVSQTTRVHPVQPMVRAYLLWAGTPALAPLAALPNGVRIPVQRNGFDGGAPVYWTKTDVAGDSTSPTVDLSVFSDTSKTIPPIIT